MNSHLRHLSRRDAVKLGLSGIAGIGVRRTVATPASVATGPQCAFSLTPAADFQDVSRGNPKPFTLTGDALLRVRLTPETWKLEVTVDDAPKEGIREITKIAKPLTLDFAALTDLGRKCGVKFLKAMQCLNIPAPLGQGLWEGVPLRELLRLCGPMINVRRVFYWGFHNDDPAQLFRSSLSYSQVMETPPGELPVLVAYKLNGEPLTLERGGPVRMVVPWAHGFKSIKWLQHIVLTNDYRANDTYAEKNNDPESHLKTAAYLDDLAPGFSARKPVRVGGVAIAGWSGLQRVECWLRPAAPDIADDDPAWESAAWIAADLAGPPADWSSVLPAGVASRDLPGFDRQTGRPLTWPLRYSMVAWSITLRDLQPGHYEIRARTVDLNGFAQPEPRPVAKTGRNGIQVRRFEITA